MPRRAPTSSTLGISQRPLSVLGLPAELADMIHRLGFFTISDLSGYFQRRAASGVSVAGGLVHAGLTDEAVQAVHDRLTVYLTEEATS